MKLTEMINVQEHALLETNRNHETAIQRRNSLGVQLLEHEEMLFSSYEKVNIQEAAITKGYMTLETLEKETKDLQLEINEEERQIDLKKKELPLRKKWEEDITMLQIELSEARDETLEGLNRTIGYKVLKGNDPTAVELIKKIEQVRSQDVTSGLPKTIWSRRYGLFPPAKGTSLQLAEEEQWNQLPNGEYTTAESRPNAYVPETGPLPLPKPYGALAPFKPSQPGANMRHIRKPTLQPLDI
ncbi:coiled-coil domain-containing protein 146-like [Notothenia coriiceps]|uniref:Coiled-coil domain-containing protein 146-like n=1 Tax=Notothenia coriiceps TaxID=8208 RepID=A0A6I9PJH7_9TELE|nr:PREDICTED: coiled-coil domain-containing protein 146-like [Notothenia coriiceps]